MLKFPEKQKNSQQKYLPRNDNSNFRKHKKKPSAITEFYSIMNRKDATYLWNFYTPCMESISKAICKFCDRKLSIGYKKFGNGPGNFFFVIKIQQNLKPHMNN